MMAKYVNFTNKSMSENDNQVYDQEVGTVKVIIVFFV